MKSSPRAFLWLRCALLLACVWMQTACAVSDSEVRLAPPDLSSPRATAAFAAFNDQITLQILERLALDGIRLER